MRDRGHWARPAATAAVVLSSVTVGCTLEEGRGFASLEPAKVRAAFEAEEGRALDGAVLTNQGYSLEIERFEVELGELGLAHSASGDSSIVFDPADPPEGYSLCHSGHCHAEDGSLVSYEAIEADLASSDASLSTLAAWHLETTVDLLSPSTLEFAEPHPSSELSMTTIRMATLTAESFELELQITGGELAESIELVLAITESIEFQAALDQEISRSGPETITPSVSLLCSALLFDGIDFSASNDTDSSSISTQIQEQLSACDFEVTLR